MPLAPLLLREQFAFLGRDRRGWREHLDRVRGFLGEGLRRADPGRPVLILGAGSGLELPWGEAPPSTVGWDADPLSRVRTALRHHRWAPWVCGDFTDAFAALEATTRRCTTQSWSGRRRSPETAAQRLAGLLPSLEAAPDTLAAWLARERPGTILSANVLGQLGVVARQVVERAFHPHSPWNPDPEAPDPLDTALEGWVGRRLREHFALLEACGAELWLTYDRAFLDPDPTLRLNPDWAEAWTTQLRSEHPNLEAQDALCGVDPLARMTGRPRLGQARWLWSLGPEQLHLMEAVAWGSPHPDLRRPAPERRFESTA